MDCDENYVNKFWEEQERRIDLHKASKQYNMLSKVLVSKVKHQNDVDKHLKGSPYVCVHMCMSKCIGICMPIMYMYVMCKYDQSRLACFKLGPA